MQQTGTDRFGNTEYASDHQDKPLFQQQANSQFGGSQSQKEEDDQDLNQQDEAYSEEQQLQNHEGVYNDEEPSKMFTFEDN